MSINFFYVLIILTGVFFTGLFAGAETGIYQLSRLRLRLGIEKKQFSSVILGKALGDSSGLLISTLVGTNLAVYLATSTISYIVLEKTQSPHSAEFLATLITAPVLFIFSELIPKNLFFYYSDALMLRIAPILFGFYKLLSWCGAIQLFKYVSKVLAKVTRTPLPSRNIISAVQRNETTAFFRDIHDESFLSAIQADILNHLLAASNITIKEVMIPFKKVQCIEINSNRQALLNTLKKSYFTRFPVYDGVPDNIIGFINIYEVLSSKQRITRLHDFIKPVRKISDDTQVMDAIEIMQNEKAKIAMVVHSTRAKKQISTGIITMKDLVEVLFGELSTW
ncbi:MAG: DUF21 domain-containing protein [Sedimentisphaerales bacterium]|nr:DUF21 domain-containing protein [Sedimentisphaerales bacterium]